MARHNSADVSVIALIGERNREVRDFLEKELSAEGLKRSVVVVATSDMPAPSADSRGVRRAGGRRIFSRPGQERAAGDGLGHAPGHGAARNRPRRGRAAQPERLHAQRLQSAARKSSSAPEISKAARSPASSPSWWKATISTSRSATRCARFSTATSFFRASSARCGHYPAIDILNSVSRLEGRVATPEQREAARKIRETLAEYQRSEDLINLGAYAAGSNPKLDSAIKLRPTLNEFLRQEPHHCEPIEQTRQKLYGLTKQMA